MKKLILAILLVMPTVSFADENKARFYIGAHSNISWSKVYDGNAGIPSWLDSSDKQQIQRIDNGNSQSNPSFSLTAGVEKRTDYWNSKNVKLLIGAELFFDNVNKTITQGYQTWRFRWPNGTYQPFINHRGNAGQPIHKTNFLTGIRGKLGINLYDMFDIYGNIGLAYWDREYLLDIQGMKTNGGYYGNILDWMQVMPVVPLFGIGTTIHITRNWAVNANYTKVLPVLYDAPGHNFANRRTSASLDVLTIGVLYYF